MKTTRLIALICIVAMLLTSSAFAQNTLLISPAPGNSFVEDFSETQFLGAPLSEYTVVLGSDATKGIQNTLSYFIKYIKEATGAELKIAAEGESTDREICIGKTDRETAKVTAARDSLTYNGVAVVADGNKIFLTGADQLGVIYSMYQFLEDYLGFRFYAADFYVAKHEYAKEFASDTNYTYSPVFIQRDSDWINVSYGTAEPYSAQRDLEFANSLRINGGNSRSFANPQKNADDFGGELTSAGNKNLIADHTGTPHDTQPCLADEEIYQKTLASVRGMLELEPDAKFVNVAINDNWDYCKCEKCSALDMSESPDGVSPNPMASVLTFVNRIARDIKDDYPDVIVATLAYTYTRVPPKTIVPEDNVMIRLCTIEACSAHPIGKDTCFATDFANQAIYDNLIKWSEISNYLSIWDYVTNFSSYLTPFPNWGTLWHNIQTYKENNVVMLFMEDNRDSFNTEFSTLRVWLLSKLMWNPDITEEEYWNLMDEFLRDYYGAGWKYIRRFIDITTECAQKYHMGLYSYPYDYIRTLSNTDKDNKEFYEQLINLFNKAYNRAETDVQKRHVRWGRTQMEFLYLQKYFNPETDTERADELWCDFFEMKALCTREYYQNRFPRRWKFIQGPYHWWNP